MRFTRRSARALCLFAVVLGACDDDSSDSDGKSAAAAATTAAAQASSSDTTSSGGVTDAPGAASGSATATADSSSAASGSAQEPPALGTDPCAAAVLCDDFEDDTSGSVPSQPWRSDTIGGEVRVSDTRAFSGTNSVHVSNTSGSYKRAYFSLRGEPVFPAVGQQMYGRMMMWLDATPAGSVHWTFIQAEGPSDDAAYDVFYRYGGQHQGRLMANFETDGVSTDCWDHSDSVMPTQTWTCLEWRFDVANDEMQFWLDGDELIDIHVTGSGEGCVGQDLAGAWPAPAQFEVLHLGWEKYQDSDEMNAWIDDVVVSNTRVGCPAAR